MNPEYQKASKNFRKLREVLLKGAAQRYANSEGLIKIVKGLALRKNAIPTVDELVEILTVRKIWRALDHSKITPSERPKDPNPELIATFDQLLLLEHSTVKLIVYSVDMRDLILVIMVANEPVKRLLFSTLSDRALNAVLDEIQYIVGVQAKYFNEACIRIIESTLELESKRQIILPRSIGSALRKQVQAHQHSLKSDSAIGKAKTQNRGGKTRESLSHKVKHQKKVASDKDSEKKKK